MDRWSTALRLRISRRKPGLRRPGLQRNSRSEAAAAGFDEQHITGLDGDFGDAGEM